jgi:tripartite-type tricarboxylate transporter receptor subunit TctC
VTVYFLHAIGIREQATFVPYKSMGGAFIDAMAGRLHLAVSSIVSASPHVNSGKLRAFAVTSARRSDSLPDTPTVAEQGARGFEASAWNGLVAPAKTPPAIVQKLSAAVAQAARTPDIRERLRAMGSEAVGSSPAEFRQLVETEIPRWRRLVVELGIKANQ